MHATMIVPSDTRELKTLLLNLSTKESISYRSSGSKDIRIYFLTERKDLLDACLRSVKDELNMTAEISTDGGTSDGRFMAKICDQVIEFGLINESIHKINEHTTKSDLDAVTKVYKSMLERLLSK